MLFDIIIPTYNNLAELKACLAGLAQQSCRSFRVIVCIDGSTDGTKEYLSSTSHPFEIIVAEHADRQNHGRNPTRNLALPHLASRYLLLLDSDAVPEPQLLEAHQRRLDAAGGVSIGIIYYSNVNTNPWARYIETRGRYVLPPLSTIGYEFFNSGNAAFESRFFIELGGQDASMTHYGAGDVEFAIRLYDRHHPVFFNTTDAVATSVMNKELNHAIDQMVEFGKYNLAYIYKKHPAHRRHYATLQMKRHPLLFGLIGNNIVRCVAKAMAGIVPGKLQLILIRYLVVTAVFKGFRQSDVFEGP
jgi:glycosyltransferase involved in cell wall biosynthesis